MRSQPRSLPGFPCSALFVGLATLVLAPPQASRAEADAAGPPGEIRFVASNLLSTANGTFERWRVIEARIDPAKLEDGYVVIEIDVASIETGIRQRDEHLRTPDFFDVTRWPTATVRVHGARREGEHEDGSPRYAAHFELRIRNVTRTVDGTFRVVGTEPLRVEGQLAIDRVDFGIGDPESRWNPVSITQRVPIEFRAALPSKALAAIAP